jgi:hypothetical protein
MEEDAIQELPRDNIDRGIIYFSIFSDFDPDIYRRLTRYLDDCVNNILPHAPFDDDVPTIPRYRHHFRTDAANLNYYDEHLITEARFYVEQNREMANRAVQRGEKRQNDDNTGRLPIKKQKGSSFKRVSTKQRRVSKQQKRRSRKQL